MTRSFLFFSFAIVLWLTPGNSSGQSTFYTDLGSAITAEVNSIYGPRYKIHIDHIDSLLGRNRGRDLAIEDPYGTLAGCTVFEAEGIYQEEDNFAPRGFVGIFKNGHVV